VVGQWVLDTMTPVDKLNGQVARDPQLLETQYPYSQSGAKVVLCMHMSIFQVFCGGKSKNIFLITVNEVFFKMQNGE